MIGHCLAALLTLSLAPLIGGINQTPVERLNYAAQHLGSSPGELGYEAKQRNFDYRRHLLQAIEGKREAVVALCEFTIAEIPTAAARRHADVLANLLQHFGDNSFSDALRGCPLSVRRRVVRALDLRLGPQLPRHYPKTAELR
jgi:hypothetical protein